MEQQESTENKANMYGSKLNNKNRGLRMVIALFVLVITLLAVAWAVVYVTRDYGNTSDQSVKTIGTEVAIVEITSEGFEPSAISVAAGQQVKFINKDSSQHRVMADPSTLDEFDSGSVLSTGDSYTYVFDKPGKYNYYDSVNPELLTGSVEVRN